MEKKHTGKSTIIQNNYNNTIIKQSKYGNRMNFYIHDFFFCGFYHGYFFQTISNRLDVNTIIWVLEINSIENIYVHILFTLNCIGIFFLHI